MGNTTTDYTEQTDPPIHEDRLAKIRWAMQQRLSEYMRRLLGDLFDEVDDYLFAKAPPGQISGEGSHLRVIREFRNKKQLFEEKFLDSIEAALQSTLIPRQRAVAVGHGSGSVSAAESSYEKMEIDLAFERMQRKAFKHYAEQIRQIKAPAGSGEKSTRSDKVIPEQRDILIRHTILALSASHEVFRVSLDNRLVFFKLFEKHFLLNLERLYQDIINIINNKDNEKFVEKLYSSSTSISRRRNRGRTAPPDSNAIDAETGNSSQNSQGIAGAVPGEFRSREVEIRAEEIVSGWCEETELPGFITEMLRSDWQNVLFLIGLNKGIDGHEWRAAQSTIARLLQIVRRTGSRDPKLNLELEEIRQQLRQGFDLAQKPLSEQLAFLRDLDTAISAPVREMKTDENTSIIDADSRPARSTPGPSRSYASVSDAGRRLFNSSDLDDFVALLSDDQGLAIAEIEEDAISMDYYLNMVDTLAEGASAELRGIRGTSPYRIQQSSSAGNSYQIMDATGKVMLTRSRVGLAVSLRSGEIRLEGQEDFTTHRKLANRSRMQVPEALDSTS